MDIKYKDKDVEISIKNVNKNAILTNDELESVVKIINLFKDFKTPMKELLSTTVQKPAEERQSSVANNDDRPVIRDRIPNQVDLSEYEIKQAVTQEPMIRCPECGQSSKAIVRINDTENYLLRKVTKNNKKTFETVMALESEEAITNMLKPEDANIMDYHNDIMKIKQNKKLKGTDLNVSNETKIQCPCCHKINPFSKWVDAFKDPLLFGFETENLCEVCGKEAVKAIDENKNEIIQCEYCGYKDPVV